MTRCQSTYFDEATVSIWLKGRRINLPLHLEAGIFAAGETARISGTLLIPEKVRHSGDPWVTFFAQDYFLFQSAYKVIVNLSAGQIEIKSHLRGNQNKNSFVIRFPRK